VPFRNAAARGELDLSAIPQRVINLPNDLLRSDILLYQSPLSDQDITEMVDQIIMPLLSAYQHPSHQRVQSVNLCANPSPNQKTPARTASE